MLNKTSQKILLDIIFGIGIALLIIGIFMLYSDVSSQVNSSVKVNYNLEEFKLNYNQLTSDKEGGDKKFVKVYIPEGVSSFRVAQIFEDKGLIKSEDFMKLIKTFEIAKRIRAGVYTFSKSENIVDILSKILLHNRR